MLLCINVKAQTTFVNVDSSNTINIYSNGTLIENNQGTVSLCNESTELADQDCNRPPIFVLILIMVIFTNFVGILIDAIDGFDCNRNVLNCIIVSTIIGITLGIMIFYSIK